MPVSSDVADTPTLHGELFAPSDAKPKGPKPGDVIVPFSDRRMFYGGTLDLIEDGLPLFQAIADGRDECLHPKPTGTESKQTFRSSSILRSMVWLKCHGQLDSPHDLSVRLSFNRRVAEAFGFDGRIPGHDTLRKRFREATTPKQRHDIDGLCDEIVLAAHERGETWVNEERLPVEERDLRGQKLTDAQKRRTVTNVWGMVEGDFDFNRGPGITWSKQYMFNVFAEGANKRITPFEVLDKERKDRGDDEDASHKAVMNAAASRSAEEWKDVIDGIFDTVFSRLQAAGYFTRVHDAYLDGTTRPMWPSGELPEGVKGGDVKESTNYAWQFATLVVEDRGVQCPVAMVPITDERPTHKQVEDLLEMATKRVNLDIVLADGGYAGARCQRAFKNAEINDYILRGSRRGNRMKRHLATMTGRFDDVDSYTTTSQDHQVRQESRLVAEPDWQYANDEVLNTVPNSAQQGLGKFGAGLNREAIDLNDINSNLWKCRRPYLTSIEDKDAQTVTEMYNKRWVVEDNYANTKRNQLGKTDSPNHAIQTFVWGLAMVFSAVWAAARIFLRLDYPTQIPHDRPTVSAREVVVFIKLEYG